MIGIPAAMILLSWIGFVEPDWYRLQVSPQTCYWMLAVGVTLFVALLGGRLADIAVGCFSRRAFWPCRHFLRNNKIG
jgi:hypothetical protein